MSRAYSMAAPGSAPSFVITALMFGLTLCAASSAADPVSWRQYDNGCPARDVPNEFLCGNYGRFYINDEPALPGCTQLAQGDDMSSPYQVVRNVMHFPAIPLPVAERSNRTVAGAAGVGQLLQPAAGLQRDRRVPWLALIDFEGAHGLSVDWLARAIAGERVASSALLLDDPAVNPNGVVTDIDVLRQLCVVAQRADNASHLMPVVNMSFGRALETGDPIDGQPCLNDALPCQIRRVAEHLVANDAIVVAAAGKQKSWLFPAALDVVVGAALMDPSNYAQNAQATATWDMPTAAAALMPGNGLCLRGGWSAPSGASYSSAILSGWLAFAMTQGVRFTAGELSALEPVYSHARGCHVLGNAQGAQYSACNEYIDVLFAGLAGQFQAFCWTGDDDRSITASLKPPTPTQPETVGVVQWDADVRPAPEGDPCVPCTGSTFARNASAGDITINLSNTRPMREELVIESVHLRAGAKFHEVALTASMLDDLRRGAIDYLVIEQGAGIASSAGSSSLFFRLRDSAATSCDDLVNGQPACGWMATHIHILQ